MIGPLSNIREQGGGGGSISNFRTNLVRFETISIIISPENDPFPKQKKKNGEKSPTTLDN